MNNLKTIAILALFLSVVLSAIAQDGDSFNTDESGLALQGYDPVAYFTQDEAVPGDPAITTDYDGVTFQFSTTNNRDLFESNPEQYLPAYGGWCAWAASQNSLADIDPTAYVVHEGRLYLNYSSFLNWRFKLKLDENIEQADVYWPDLAEQVPGR